MRVNRSDFAHFTSLPVQWADMDAIGHVNHAVFFRYVETGRIAYFEAAGAGVLSSRPDGEGPILADIQCSFIGQLHYPARIEVATRTAKLGDKSWTIESAIFVDGEAEPVATSRAIIVWFDYKQQASARIPDDLRKRITELDRGVP